MSDSTVPCQTGSYSKETNSIFKMTMFCDEEDTNTFQVPNEVKKNHKYNMLGMYNDNVNTI